MKSYPVPSTIFAKMYPKSKNNVFIKTLFNIVCQYFLIPKTKHSETGCRSTRHSPGKESGMTKKIATPDQVGNASKENELSNSTFLFIYLRHKDKLLRRHNEH